MWTCFLGDMKSLVWKQLVRENENKLHYTHTHYSCNGPVLSSKTEPVVFKIRCQDAAVGLISSLL